MIKKIFASKILYSIAALLIISAIALWLCNNLISRAAQNKLYASVQAIPFNKVGLLLGTAKHLQGGFINPYYRYRIDATLDLMRAKKIRYLIISGDNSRKEYNEPRMMKNDLINAGIDSNTIFLDYAGFRTFDSMVRLKKVFGQNSVTVISQQFHNERALYIASQEGIAAIGFNAKDTGNKFGLRTQIREKFARVKVFVDYLIGEEPKFLGKKEIIPN